jgi:hypothetical protein
MQLIQSSKGAGLANVSWTYPQGKPPVQDLDFICWCSINDPEYDKVLAHMKAAL